MICVGGGLPLSGYLLCKYAATPSQFHCMGELKNAAEQEKMRRVWRAAGPHAKPPQVARIEIRPLADRKATPK